MQSSKTVKDTLAQCVIVLQTTTTTTVFSDLNYSQKPVIEFYHLCVSSSLKEDKSTSNRELKKLQITC